MDERHALAQVQPFLDFATVVLCFLRLPNGGGEHFRGGSIKRCAPDWIECDHLAQFPDLQSSLEALRSLSGDVELGGRRIKSHQRPRSFPPAVVRLVRLAARPGSRPFTRPVVVPRRSCADVRQPKAHPTPRQLDRWRIIPAGELKPTNCNIKKVASVLKNDHGRVIAAVDE
jgi:hypothetical protein